MDRAGNIVGTVGEPDDAGLANPELAPDGRRVAVTRQTQGPPNVWLIDVARGVPTRLTFGPGNHNAPFWSPDGTRVLFGSQLGGVRNLFVKAVDGLGDAKVLFESDNSKTPSGWSPDGRVVLYVVAGDDLMGVDVESKKSFPVAQTSANEGWGEFFPMGDSWRISPTNRSDLKSMFGRFRVRRASGSCQSQAERSRAGVATGKNSTTWRLTSA